MPRGPRGTHPRRTHPRPGRRGRRRATSTTAARRKPRPPRRRRGADGPGGPSARGAGGGRVADEDPRGAAPAGDLPRPTCRRCSRGTSGRRCEWGPLLSVPRRQQWNCGGCAGARGCRAGRFVQEGVRRVGRHRIRVLNVKPQGAQGCARDEQDPKGARLQAPCHALGGHMDLSGGLGWGPHARELHLHAARQPPQPHVAPRGRGVWGAACTTDCTAIFAWLQLPPALCTRDAAAGPHLMDHSREGKGRGRHGRAWKLLSVECAMRSQGSFREGMPSGYFSLAQRIA
jgi:hypothetical protein